MARVNFRTVNTRKTSQVLSLVAAGASLGIAVTVFDFRPSWSYYLPILVLAASIMLYLIWLWQRAGSWDLADMRLWFAGFFLFYGITEPLTKANPYFLPSAETFLNATWLFCLGGLGLLLSTLLSPRYCTGPIHTDNVRLLFFLKWLAIAGVFLGLGMMWLDFQRIGGILYAFSAPKSLIMETLSEARGNLPYVPLLITSLSLLFFSLLHWPRTRSRLAWAFFGFSSLPFFCNSNCPGIC